MISASTGEVSFGTGLRIMGHQLITSALAGIPKREVSLEPWGVEGWSQHKLGEHQSDRGEFTVEVVTGPERRIEGVFLSHFHEFYESDTPNDSERRMYHDGVIASELYGQREFSWGHVFCRVDSKNNRDWLVVIYSPFSSIPLHKREVYRHLIEHQKPDTR